MHEFELHDLQLRLEKALKRTFDGLPIHRLKKKTIQRATIEVCDIDPIDWLSAQEAHAKIYWSRRDKSQIIAGCDAVHHLITDSLEVLRSIRNYLDGSDAAIRYFGGMRFDPKGKISHEWQPYAKFRFFVPRFELTTSSQAQTLALNFFISPDDDLPKLYTELKRAIQNLRSPEPVGDCLLPDIVEKLEQPDQRQWTLVTKEALAAIDSGEFEKIVLAGQTILSFHNPMNPYVLLRQILKKNGRTFHFAFQFEQGACFIGMSPECLFQRQGDHMCTEAIASTRPRGVTPEEDDDLGKDMVESDKDLREHRWVKKMIVDRLNSYCANINETSDEKLLKLSHVQHLISEFHADLHAGVENEKILEALHPTPAVGGYPKIPAVAKISQLEPFDRGWYSAPVGWVSNDAAEFAVAIRSALVRKEKLHIYAGSGIVKGSDPAKEWDENRNKAQNFLQLFKETC